MMYELRSGNDKEIEQAEKVLNVMLEGVEVVSLRGVNLRNVESFKIEYSEDNDSYYLIVDFKNEEYATTEIYLPDEVLKASTNFGGVPYMNIAIMDNEDVAGC